MRKYVIGAAVVVVALITAAVAFGVTTRTYTQAFAVGKGSPPVAGAPVTKPNRPAPTFLKEHSEDPANPENHQPKLDSSVDDIFPNGAKIDQSAADSCKASDNDFATKGPAVCSQKSKIGSGHAKVRAKFNGTNDIPASITAFNCQKGCKPAAGSGVAPKNEVILYVNPQGANPIVLRAEVKGTKNQKILHVPIPINCVLGSPPSCTASNGSNAGDVRIVDLDLTVNKITKKVKKHGKQITKAFLRTPKTCPANKKWTFTIKFHGRDGVTQTYTSNAPCKK